MSSNIHLSAHIRLHTRCDLCDYSMVDGQKFIVLVGNSTSTSWKLSITAPDYPAGRYGAEAQVVVGRWLLCRGFFCPGCNHSPEAATFHPDCLQLFMRNCTCRDALERLWVAVVWNKALAGVKTKPLRLRKGTSTLSSAFAFVARTCDLPQMKRLPPEIRDIIQELSEPCNLLRYVSVLEFAWRLSACPSEVLSSLPLSHVSSWARGSPPELVGEDTVPLPVIRCTIDALGLKRIERLAARPDFEAKRCDNMVFIVEAEDLFYDADVQFKDGIARLDVPLSGRNLQIWDTPSPPDLFRHHANHEGTAMRYSTIDLDAITGLTFVLFHDNIIAVHPHTKTAVSAVSTVDRIHDSYERDEFIWVYVPFPAGERLIGFEPLVNFDDSFSLRMLLAGDVVVGEYAKVGIPWPGALTRLTSYPPSKGQPAIRTLIHHPLYTCPIITPYPIPEDAPADDGAILTERPPTHECPDTEWYSSYARLENVRRVHVFQDLEGVYCRGLLFEYENGAERAVGQCRLHVDRVRTFEKPKTICFSRHEKRSLVRTRVYFCDLYGQGDEYQWVLPMAGMLGFYFNEPQEHTWLCVCPPRPATDPE